MHRSSRGLTCWIVGLALALGLPAAAAAAVAVVTTTDGRVFEGELISESDREVVLAIAGIRTPIDRKIVAHVEIKKTIEDEYRDRRARLEDDDLNGRYTLAYYLFRNDALELARQELDDLSRRFPDDGRVSRLKTVVEQKLRQAAEKKATPEQAPPPRDQPANRGEAEPPQTPDAEPVGLSPRLTPEQINLIRVYEARLDEKPGIQIPPQTIERFLQQYGRDPLLPKDRASLNAFRRAQGYDQVKWLFAVKAREFYPEVQVRDDPPAMRAFRTQVHRQYVLNYCGTSRCHGGEPPASAPGGLYLFQFQPTSNRTVYTNFYILDQYRNADGRMLDRNTPARSLLLQYGLDPQVAATPHPAVPGWRPQFFSTADARFRQYAKVIRGFWWEQAPDYGLDYTPPGRPPSPGPATQEEAAKPQATEPPRGEKASEPTTTDP